MDYKFQSHIKRLLKRIINKRPTHEQILLLEASFSFNNKLDTEYKSQLAQELGLPPRQIAIWHQNKRARWKRQSLEVEYKTLEKRLQRALLDNDRLGREAGRLKEELDIAKEMLISLNTGSYSSSFIPSSSHSCDEVGTLISLEQYDHPRLDKDLFACFNGGEGRFDDTNDLYCLPKY